MKPEVPQYSRVQNMNQMSSWTEWIWDHLTGHFGFSFPCFSLVKQFALWVTNSNQDWKQVSLPALIYNEFYTLNKGPHHCSICDDFLGRLYSIIEVLTADRVFWKCFTLPQYCQTFSKRVTNACFTGWMNHNHLPLTPLACLSRSHHLHLHSGPCFLPQSHPSHAVHHTSSWLWEARTHSSAGRQLVQQQGPAWRCFLTDAGKWHCFPQAALRQLDLLQHCCCT